MKIEINPGVNLLFPKFDTKGDPSKNVQKHRLIEEQLFSINGGFSTFLTYFYLMSGFNVKHFVFNYKFNSHAVGMNL